MSRRETRPSPTESATDFPLHYERVGGDGKYWHVSEDKRGVRRWKKGLYHGPLSSTSESFIKDELSGDTMEDKTDHRGLDSLFDRDSPMPAEEPTPEEVVEVEKDTVMSKLRGSVNVPEEFKFADDMTFYTMLRNIFRGKNILITGPSGCGMSSLGKILADITAKDFYSFNFGDTMNPSAR